MAEAPLRIGQLDKRASLRASVEVLDPDTGGWATTYSIVASRFAVSVMPKGGKRIVSGEQMDARTNYLIQMWHRTDVDITTLPRHQLVYHARGGDRVFDITSAIDIGERFHVWQLECTEGQ